MKTVLENEILALAIKALEINIDLPIEIHVKDHINEKFKYEKLIKIKIRENELEYCAFIKTIINNTTPGLLLHQKEYCPHHQLLITKYINPVMAAELRKNGIQFIDTAGNVYLNSHPIYIYIKGNKVQNIFNKQLPVRAFKPTGLKMIYALLNNPDLINQPYRDIAKVAEIALGTVGWIFRDLRELGYLVDMGKKGKKLQNRNGLFDRWCTAYVENLKPKLLIGKFGGPDHLWEKYNLNPDFALWGGEVAAMMLTKYLKPQNTIIYVDRNFYKNIIIENKLYKNDLGEIELYERFGPVKIIPDFDNIVHPFLVYADLMGSGNQRNIETAKRIYDQYIVGHIGED